MGFAFDSSRDTELYRGDGLFGYYKPGDEGVYVVEPADRVPRGVIVHVHGLCENAFRFFHAARHWATRGWRVVMFHLLAHGCRAKDAADVHWLARLYLSETLPDRILYALTHELNVETAALEDVRHANVEAMSTTRMEEHFAQLETVWRALGDDASPRFAAGHSLGGLVACEGAYRLAGMEGVRPPTGTVLFSPALRPIARGGLNHVVQGSWLARRTPWLAPVAWAMDGLAALNFRIPANMMSNFVSDIPEQCRLHREDPLVLKHIRTKYLARIEHQMLTTIDRGRSYPHDVILFASEHDQIVNTLGSKKFMKDLQQRRGVKAGTAVFFEGRHAHNPLRATMAGPMLARLDRWLDERVEG
ncbi:MAG: alpha/beta fold hydrolase [Planctomycetota bacterium]|jgi:alpha-beta hydrolase superfamily lysophospholipase